MTVYTLRYDSESGRSVGVVRQSDGAQIPADPRNSDYAAFLEWNSRQSPPLDLSDRAPPTDAERAARDRASAAALVTDGAPDRMLIRGALKLIHGAFVEQASWNAKVRQRLTVAGLGDPGAPPVVRDWAALMAALTQLIAGGAGDPPAQPAPVPPP